MAASEYLHFEKLHLKYPVLGEQIKKRKITQQISVSKINYSI